MNYETQCFNTEFNGFKADTSNSWIKWVALAGNITNITLSSTNIFKCNNCNDCNSHHRPRQAGA